MRNYILILPALLVFLASCEREPFADFTVSSQSVEVFETVFFTNLSSGHADYFEWDFGDGTWSDAVNASHYYEHAGSYNVTLTAYNGNRVADKSYMTIEVLTTYLNVIVEEYYDLYRVAGASVILYPTLADWENETNAVAEVYTDDNGVATFENLNPAVYFVDVWHPTHNNYQLASEDVSYIMTPQLYRFEVNEFVAYVDYVGSTSRMEGKRTAKLNILKVAPRSYNIKK